MQPRSALILGGAGFIGTHLARHLLERGFRRVMSLDIEAPRRPVSRVIYNIHDVREPIYRTIDSHFDAVFNLAAIHRTPGHSDAEYYDTNVAGAINCSAYCERNGIDTVFFTSSISVYGPSEDALDEDSDLTPESAYGRSKRLAEQIHCNWQQRDRARRLRIVRPAVVFGEGENANYTRLAQVLKRGTFVFPGRKDTFKAGGYVKELVETISFALDRPEPFYLYNFADPHCPTIEEICDTFRSQAGARAPLGVLPLPIIKAGASVCEALNALGLRNPINRARINKLVHSTNVSPARLVADGYSFSFNLDSAIRDWVACDAALRPMRTRHAQTLRHLPQPTTSSALEAVPAKPARA